MQRPILQVGVQGDQGVSASWSANLPLPDCGRLPVTRNPTRWPTELGTPLLNCFSSTLLEQVFVLCVSDDQCSLRAGADHELGPIYARRSRDERNGSVGILAAADFALPLAEVEDSP